MGSPKRAYLALDASFPYDDKVEELGERHGPAGPMVIVALLCAAKREPLASRAGTVFTTSKRLAAEASLTDGDQVRAIVTDACALGILEELPSNGGDRSIEVRFVRWADWQDRQKGADKQAAYRERLRTTAGDSK